MQTLHFKKRESSKLYPGFSDSLSSPYPLDNQSSNITKSKHLLPTAKSMQKSSIFLTKNLKRYGRILHIKHLVYMMRFKNLLISEYKRRENGKISMVLHCFIPLKKKKKYFLWSLLMHLILKQSMSKKTSDGDDDKDAIFLFQLRK